MKVVAFNGSPRKQGNTASMLSLALSELENQGIETELVHIGGQSVRGCTGCRQCRQLMGRKCVIEGDFVNSCIEKMIVADGIILGSPTYFADITTEMKALIDRAGVVCRANGDLLARKVGASVAVQRRAGAIHAFDSMNHFFLIEQMIVVGSCYWNVINANNPGDAEKDEEGVKTIKTLGQNMAWLLKKLA
ncbi:MAG: flavodoxin family protein [Sedimentisphaerales bacterium]|nr:flavodoxin family protein [Sedimentisphaerales bacterium]MBN2843629.1 flavodoxin family protein [Sedimentisphaerales bacterium]